MELLDADEEGFMPLHRHVLGVILLLFVTL